MTDARGTDARLTHAPFWFLRHGQTDWNKDNLAQGYVDVPLNADGLAQAHKVAGLLRGRGIASIVCSPLSRARRTAEIVADTLNVAATVEDALHEASFGVMEGKPMLAQWFTDWIAGTATPQDAEPFAALVTRVVGAVDEALRTQPAPVLIVAHGAVFRALRQAMGLAPDVRLMNAIPQYCRPGTPWTLEAA